MRTQRKNYGRLLLIGLALFIIILLIEIGGGGDGPGWSADGRTITVDDDGGGGADYDNVQDAVDAVEEGDLIFVKNGHYGEEVSSEKTIQIQGESREGVYITGIYQEEGGNSSFSNFTTSHISLMEECNNITISNCSFIGETYDAIYIRGNYNNTISNCSFDVDANYGIRLSDTYNSTIDYCQFWNRSVSMNMDDLGDLLSMTFISNTVNGKPLYVYKNVSSFTAPPDAGQIILINCSDVIIQDLSLSFVDIGLQILHSKNITVTGCRFSNNSRGIIAKFSNNLRIEGSSIFINHYGVTLIDCRHNLIRNCSIFNNQWGSFGHGISVHDGKNTTISYCSVFNQQGNRGRGITISGRSEDVDIHNCAFYGNEYYAVIAVDNCYSVDAEDCWWGHPSGPYHENTNDHGEGDNVSSDVDFEPWLTQSLFGPTTFYVDDDASPDGDGSLSHPFQNVQDAVNASEDGDTIRVFTGMYFENVVVNRSVSLIGNGSGVTIIITAGSDYIIDIVVNHVNISGFNFTGNTNDHSGLGIHSNWNIISENVFYDNHGSGIGLFGRHNVIAENVIMDNGNGIEISSDFNTITNNMISDEYRGLYLRHSSDFNSIQGNIFSYCEEGMYHYNSQNNSITENTFSDCGRGVKIQYSEWITIENNTFDSNGQGIIFEYSDYSTIANNTFQFNRIIALSLDHSEHNTIESNTIKENTAGILFERSSFKNEVHENEIVGNSEYGINATENSGYYIAAEYNDWGTSSGPHHPLFNPGGQGDNVTDYVIFEPWIGGPPIRYVDDDAAPGGNGSLAHPFQRIQDAIDGGINGDIIRVFNGTYYENVLVDKRVSLIGNGSETTIIDAGGEGDVVRIAAWSVNMSGFSLIGSGDHRSGLYASSIHNCNIFQNNFSNNYYGMLVRYPSNTYITNNTLSNNTIGILILNSNGITLTGNLMDRCGIVIEGDFGDWTSNSIDVSNTVNGKPVRYFANTNDKTVPSGAGQVILGNCSNVTIAGQQCNVATIGIQVGFSSGIIISDNVCSFNINGINIISSNNCTILNNNCSFNQESGINVERSENCKIEDNTCSNNLFWGIYLDHSFNCSLSFNNCSWNTYSGIYHIHSHGSSISHNICQHDRMGLTLTYSSNCTIDSNKFSFNDNGGIYLRTTKHCVINDNNITENDYGISLTEASSGNSAHYNYIYNNRNYGISANLAFSFNIDAIRNWWGNASGPYHNVLNPTGTGDQISYYVLFDPWIGIPQTLYVDDDAPPGGNGSLPQPFSSIQDAIDSSWEGDTIRVFEGTYYENVIVNKSVNVIGNGSQNTTIAGWEGGILVRLISNNITFSGFTITNEQDNFYGIHVNSNNSLIMNINCSGNYYGISFVLSDNNTILNSIFSFNRQKGVSLSFSHNNTFENNTIIGNWNKGITAYSSNDILISRSWVCENGEDGISITESQRWTINDTISDGNERDGISVDRSKEIDLNNVTCNDNEGNGVELSYSSFNRINASNFCYNGMSGVVSSVNGNNHLSSINASNNMIDGIKVTSSHDNSILGSIFSSNQYYGIRNWDSESNTYLVNMVLNNSLGGILIQGRANCIIAGNVVSLNGEHGIYLYDSSDNTLRQNNCTNNNLNGIWLWKSYDNNITDTYCVQNGGNGIWLRDSNDNEISFSILVGNLNGFNVSGDSNNNYIHSNEILENSNYGVIALENSDNVDVRDNWWGTNSGPYHSRANPDGLGDTVSDNVTFIPWIGMIYYNVTWYVDDDAPPGGDGSLPRPFNSIQDAIDSSSDGDTIKVLPGTYYEIIIVDTSVSLIGNGSDVTTIDGGGVGSVVTTTGDGINISGFTVRDSGDGNWASGIFIIGNHTRVSSSRILNCEVGIRLFHVKNSIIHANEISGNHDGVHSERSDLSEIVNNSCNENDNSGMMITGQSNNNLIHGNIMVSNGVYGLFVTGDHNIITENIIQFNSVGVRNSGEHNQVHHNKIVMNELFGVFSSSQINATLNWWGDNSGPYHSARNEQGTGNSVSGNVDFDPWLTEEDITLYVDDDALPGGDGSPPHPFSSIQDAIDNTTMGDFIRVFDGTYYENIIINKSVHLIGNGSTTTFLHGPDGGELVVITADSVEFTGFTIGYINTGHNYGLTIHSSDVHVHHCNFTENFEGIRILYHNTGIRIEHNEFYRNMVYGINCYSVRDSDFGNNSFIEQLVFGLYFWNSSNNHIHGNLFSSNGRAGLYFEDSHNNTAIGNIISNSDNGMEFVSTLYAHLKPSTDNLINNNTIHGNTKTGINATKNKGFTVDATFNYWAHLSGPHHPTLNPRGKGDNITDFVLFEPWIDENGTLIFVPDDDNEKEQALWLFRVLVIIMVCLFMALIFVIRVPEEQFGKLRVGGGDKRPGSGGTSVVQRMDGSEVKGRHSNRSSFQKGEPHNIESWDGPLQKAIVIEGRPITCEYCGGIFRINEEERSIRVPCPHCTKNTLNG